MTTHTCDACGNKVSHLCNLQDHWRTSAIQEVCHDCEKRVEKEIIRIKAENQKSLETYIKKFLKNINELS